MKIVSDQEDKCTASPWFRPPMCSIRCVLGVIFEQEKVRYGESHLGNTLMLVKPNWMDQRCRKFVFITQLKKVNKRIKA